MSCSVKKNGSTRELTCAVGVKWFSSIYTVVGWTRFCRFYIKKTTVRLVHYRVQCTVGAKFLLFVKMFNKVASFVLYTVKQLIHLNSVLHTLDRVVCYNKNMTFLSWAHFSILKMYWKLNKGVIGDAIKDFFEGENVESWKRRKSSDIAPNCQIVSVNSTK